MAHQVNKLLKTLKFNYVEIIPCSAILDINITSKSFKTAWYKGATLIDFFKKAKNVTKKNPLYTQLFSTW